MAHDGTALGALSEIIEAAGGTSDAATLVPAIEDLGEIIGSGGGGGGIADGSVTTAKLANKAVTNGKLADRAVSWAKLEDSAVDTKKLVNFAVTTDKLDSGAVTTAKLADGAVAYGKIDPNAVTLIRSVWLVAANSQTDQALTALGFDHDMFTPKEMAVNGRYVNGTLRLCWISGTTLEVAPINFFGNLQTQAVTLYAKGSKSMASGTLGVDESWTITANE